MLSHPLDCLLWLVSVIRSRYALSWSQKMLEKGKKIFHIVLPLCLVAPMGEQMFSRPMGDRN